MKTERDRFHKVGIIVVKLFCSTLGKSTPRSIQQPKSKIDTEFHETAMKGGAKSHMAG